jgi:hypothetical protein
MLLSTVLVQGGKYVVCGKCQVEVVGMYYTSTCVADYSLCARCFHQELLRWVTTRFWPLSIVIGPLH